MKIAHLKSVERQIVGVEDIPMQPASQDIWDKKYRLKTKEGTPIDEDIDGTYRRIARALAEVEATPELRTTWYEKFLWALRHGAIPAGRITSNAGALEHKPATSTINCTVSGTVQDSMDDILDKVHEAGLTLKAGCGIGYDFSTLRPRGAYVSGALDLSFASAKGITRLAFCRFQNNIEMLQTSLEFLNLTESHLIGLNAQGARITGDVFLRNVTATATIDLSGAEIGGQLECTDAQLNATEGDALNAQGARITQDVFLPNVIATATIALNGAEIGGQLNCTDAQLNAADGHALNAQGARITESVYLRNVTATATIDLIGAEIGGQLDCTGAQLKVMPSMRNVCGSPKVSSFTISTQRPPFTSAVLRSADSWTAGMRS